VLHASVFKPVMILISLSLSGCAAAVSGAGHRSSPWEFGGGVRAGLLYPIDAVGVSAGPMASYSYLRWDGGGGHDHLFELAAQIRKAITAADRSPWVSAEAGFAHMTSVSGEFDANSSGWSAWVHAGLPITQNISAFGGGGLTGLWDGTGKNFRLGLEMRP
jgi:hypothetical protein